MAKNEPRMANNEREKASSRVNKEYIMQTKIVSVCAKMNYHCDDKEMWLNVEHPTYTSSVCILLHR